MLRHTTTFVIGAGANYDLDMPLGVRLADEIRDISNNINLYLNFGQKNSSDIYIQCARNAGLTIGEISEAINLIRRGILGQNSIDDFLHIHHDNNILVKISKIIISGAILNFENKSKLLKEKNRESSIEFDFSDIRSSWYHSFFKLLFGNVRKEQITENLERSKFVIFNYDRCFEYIMYNGIQKLYGESPEFASGIMEKFQISHPYGHLGPIFSSNLLTQKSNLGLTLKFNDNVHRITLGAERIKTYMEDQSENSEIKISKRAIESSDYIVSLGFGFHRQNLEILRPNYKSNLRFFGTAMKFSEENIQAIESDIRSIFCDSSDAAQFHKFSTRLLNSSCADFIERLSRTLFT
ncbi:MAG: hypothetical protein O9342_07135 [Beijerinckiaceae bacterium]|nr:hypothetical protein [Beijerinckiaceae bacterium]